MQSDERSDHILGVWLLQDYGAGPYSMSQIAFLADGRKCVIGFEAENSTFVVDAYLNRWTIVGDTLITTFGLNTASIEVGFVMQDRILRLDGSRMDLSMTVPLGDRVEVHRKLDEFEGTRVCALASRMIQERSSL